MNNDNRIVGLLFGGGKDADGNKTCTYACHIRHVQNCLDIQVATATSSGVVNTVPGTGNPSSSTVTATAGTEVNMNPRVTVSRNQMEALQQAEKDIMETHDGRLFYGLYKKHLDEIRYLINHNRKVATVWHRNGGPAFINRLIYSAEFPEEEFPHTINGLSVRESMKRIGDIFRKYGGESLREDMEKYGAVVTSICGMTYSRVLQKMREGNLFSELAIRPTLLNRRGNT